MCVNRYLLKPIPELYLGLLEYRQLIQECDSKYTWSAVYTYDVRYRSKLASFGTMDSELFVTILDATAVKSGPLACFRCKSHEHKMASCPFLAFQSSMEASAQK